MQRTTDSQRESEYVPMAMVDMMANSNPTYLHITDQAVSDLTLSHLATQGMSSSYLSDNIVNVS